MNFNKTEKNITITDKGNTVIYYISKNNKLVKLSAFIIDNNKDKTFRGVIDFTNMLSCWRGNGSRLNENIETLLDNYDKKAISYYNNI